jgi:hypothetical protein
MTFKVSRHGWLLDLPGHRDRLCAVPLALDDACNARRLLIKASPAVARPTPVKIPPVISGQSAPFND